MPVSSHMVRSKGEAVERVSEGSKPEEAQARPFTKDLRHHPTYRPDIDGLRAVAIIPVVIFHAFPSLLPGGFVGVDIFFVISGFLISSIILKGLQRGTFSFSGFYANRIKRIFPALLLMLGTSFVLGWFFLLPGEYAQLGKHILGGAGYVENFVLLREAGYFDTRSFLKPLMHLWSLGIEEQFYLTYPFLLWLGWHLRRSLLAIIVTLVLISFSLNVWQVRGNVAASFLLPQTRFWELWAGGILAYLEVFQQDVRSRLPENWARFTSPISQRKLTYPDAAIVNSVLSIVGMVLVGAALLLVRENAFPGWWALLPVCGASLLILAGPDAWINRKILSNKAAVFVGLISYPLYLWHWPILSFLRIIRGGEPSSSVRTIAVIVGLVLSWATWHFVERPIRFGRKTWIKTAALAGICVIVGCIGYTIFHQDGFAGRFKNIPDDFGWAQAQPQSTPGCRKTVASDKMEYCQSFGVGPPDVLLIGDSHAASLYRGLAPAYQKGSHTLMNLGAPACAPFYDTESYALGMQQERDCKLIVNQMLEFATSTGSVRTVILSVRGPLNMSGDYFGEEGRGAPKEIVVWDGAPKGSSQAEMFAGAFRNTILRLSAAGKNVILFVDWPELGFDPRSCLPRPVPWLSRTRSFCGVPRSQVDTRNQAYREAIFGLEREFSGLRVFDPLPYLCDSQTCYVMSGGHLLYRDDNHLSVAGATYLSEKFMAKQGSLSP